MDHVLSILDENGAVRLKATGLGDASDGEWWEVLRQVRSAQVRARQRGGISAATLLRLLRLVCKKGPVIQAIREGTLCLLDHDNSVEWEPAWLWRFETKRRAIARRKRYADADRFQQWDWNPRSPGGVAGRSAYITHDGFIRVTDDLEAAVGFDF